MKDSLPEDTPLSSRGRHPKGLGASQPLFSHSRIRERFKQLPAPHRLIFVVMTALIILSSLFGGVAYGIYAANQPVKLPIKEAKTTLKQFYDQAAAKGNKGAQVTPKGSQVLPYWKNEPAEPKEQKPSAAPATMKTTSATIPRV